MPPQSQGPVDPEQVRASRAERRVSGRAQRKVAAEQAARRRRLTLIGGAIAAVLVVALVAFLVTRPRDLGPPVLAAAPLSDAIAVDGMAMGPEDAPVTVVEWGDYT